MLSTGQTRVRAWESICRGLQLGLGLVIGTGTAGQGHVEDIRWHPRILSYAIRTGWPGRERDQSGQIVHGLGWAGLDLNRSAGRVGFGAVIDKVLRHKKLLLLMIPKKWHRRPERRSFQPWTQVWSFTQTQTHKTALLRFALGDL